MVKEQYTTRLSNKFWTFMPKNVPLLHRNKLSVWKRSYFQYDYSVYTIETYKAINDNNQGVCVFIVEG
jgi:hypothetical protein